MSREKKDVTGKKKRPSRLNNVDEILKIKKQAWFKF